MDPDYFLYRAMNLAGIQSSQRGPENFVVEDDKTIITTSTSATFKRTNVATQSTKKMANYLFSTIADWERDMRPERRAFYDLNFDVHRNSLATWARGEVEEAVGLSDADIIRKFRESRERHEAGEGVPFSSIQLPADHNPHRGQAVSLVTHSKALNSRKRCFCLKHPLAWISDKFGAHQQSKCSSYESCPLGL